MSKLLLNSMSNLGKLMNVGSRNYASYSPAVNRFVSHLNETDVNRFKLKKLGEFDVLSVDKKTNFVKLVKDMGNEKLKISFNLQNFIDAEAFWSNNQSLERHLNSKSTEVFYSDTEFFDKFLEIIDKKTLLVELDKGQRRNFLMMCSLSQSENNFDAEFIELMDKNPSVTDYPYAFVSEEFKNFITNSMIKYDVKESKVDEFKQLFHCCFVLSNELSNILSDVFIEKGLTSSFVDELNHWFTRFEDKEAKKNESLTEIRNFLLS